MDEKVAAAYSVEQQPVGRFVKERNKFPGEEFETREEEAQGEVLEKGGQAGAAPDESKGQSKNQARADTQQRAVDPGVEEVGDRSAEQPKNRSRAETEEI